MSTVDKSKIIPTHELEEIMAKLETLHKKQFAPRSSYTFFVQTVSKKEAGSNKMSWAEAGVKWKGMSPKEKSPYETMHNTEKLKSLEMKQNYDTYMQKVGPRLLDHDEEMEKTEVAKRKRDAEQAYVENKAREKKSASIRKVNRRTVRPPPVRRVVEAAAPGANESDKSTDQAKDRMMRGLDPTVWSIKQSRSRPGVMYYFNAKTNTSQINKPEEEPAKTKAKAKAGSTPRVVESSKRLRSKGSPNPSKVARTK